MKSVPFDVERIREDFPILGIEAHGSPLVYLDNAATSQKPKAVLRAVQDFYTKRNGNIHRGVHYLSQVATEDYDEARRKVQRFIGAERVDEIVFVRGATEGINLVAYGLGEVWLKAGDEILLTRMEHHANIVPWQIVAERTGARIVVAEMTAEGALDMADLVAKISAKTRLIGVTHVSNALGTINPVAEIVRLGHEVGAVVVVDGCQAAPHLRVNVTELGCDFYVFSGHKVCAPTGIGVLYGKREWLEKLPPYQSGGDMIGRVSFEKGTTFRKAPEKFEAGTPNISGAIGLGAALDYVEAIGTGEIECAERELLEYATQKLKEVPGLRIFGDVRDKVPVISFVLEGVHPHDIGTILDSDGIAVRAGHHCAQPLMDFFGVPAMARASFSFYNTKAEVNALADSLRKISKMFA